VDERIAGAPGFQAGRSELRLQEPVEALSRLRLLHRLALMVVLYHAFAYHDIHFFGGRSFAPSERYTVSSRKEKWP
jgi:hypothetical protein